MSDDSTKQKKAPVLTNLPHSFSTNLPYFSKVSVLKLLVRLFVWNACNTIKLVSQYAQ